MFPAPDHQSVGGGQLLDAGKDRPGGEHHAETEIVLQRLGMNAARDFRVGQDRLGLRAKHDPVAGAVQVERFDAETVAGEQHRLAPRVPGREGEHAAKAGDEGLAFLFVTVDEHLGVRLRGKAVPPAFQPGAKFAVVVDFAVEDDLNRAVLAAHWLGAAGQVND